MPKASSAPGCVGTSSTWINRSGKWREEGSVAHKSGRSLYHKTSRKIAEQILCERTFKDKLFAFSRKCFAMRWNLIWTTIQKAQYEWLGASPPQGLTELRLRKAPSIRPIMRDSSNQLDFPAS